MPSRPRAGSLRAVVAALTAAILGVLGLGTTAIVAAPVTDANQAGTVLSTANAGAKGTNDPRLISWSGHQWMIYPNDQRGPESVKLTNSTRAVYVDHRGRLHMKIMKIGGVWRSVELELLDPSSVTYGTYRWVVDSRTAKLDPWAVLGMFVYQPHTKKYTNEIDIENSRFPHLLKAPNNAQFTVQPYYAPKHQHEYHIKKTYKPLSQQFTWLPGTASDGNGTVKFETRVGASKHSPLLARWTYHGYSVPKPGFLGIQPKHLYLILWMNKNKAPKHGTHSAIIRRFSFTPLGG